MTIFDELKIALRSAMIRHVDALKTRYGSSDLYGFSVYTEDGLSSIGAVANTAGNIRVPDSDPDYNYFRYGPHEWALFDDYGLFDQVNRIIKDIHENSGLPFETRREAMLQVALQVLVELEADGLFGPRTPSRYVVLWLADSGDPIMSASAEALNDPVVFLAYQSAYADQA